MGDAAALAAALRAAAPSEHARWLDEPDEPAFQELLRARYGDTYSYRDFYQPGGLARLWRSGALLSLGEYNDDGLMVAHTGLILHPGRDYAESGLSLVHPRRRSAMTRAEHRRAWDHVLARLRGVVGFLHQHTSTLHPRAQHYARRFMAAEPTGLVVDYTAGETLVGLDASAAPMQALTMSTRLAPASPAARHLPAGPWGEWLAATCERLGGGPCVLVPLAPAGLQNLVFGTCDDNRGLQLTRRWVVGLGDASAELAAPGARVDLVHLPVDDPGLVARGAALLFAGGYLPVGVRPGRSVDTVVWQRLPDRAAARASAARAIVADADSKALFAGWIDRCAPTP